MKDKESYFISLFKNDHIGDDGAIIGDVVYSSDLFCEDIHFKREWMSLDEISYKSMLINISDAIVMNAKPRYALLNVKLPKNFTKEEMDLFSSGFKKAIDCYNIEIIGGDTVAGDTLDISITIISYTTNPIKRDGLNLDDIIGYSGDLGSVGSDLSKLLSGKKIDKESKFIKPTLRSDFFYKVAPYLTSAMDISDGLSKDLSRLSEINGVGFEFFVDLGKDLLCSGEEYEVLFSCNEKDLDKIKEIAKITSTPVTFFAKAVDGSYKSICKENHFE
jgi:thiamine-monophosphate kinase